eukprot:PRCOL_00005884-RA
MHIPAGEDRQYEFGKAGAAAEVWEAQASHARDAFRAELAAAPAGGAADADVMRAALALAAEDDAVRTRTVVELPTASYEARVDKLVREIAANVLPGVEGGEAAKLAAVCDYLFVRYGWKLPSREEMASPYRTYMHNVLAQKCGVPPALGALLYAVLQRLQAQGDVGEFEVVVPSNEQHSLPYARVAAGAAEAGAEAATPEGLMADTLASLKRAYWPWVWPDTDYSGFLASAEAAVSTHGRVGRVGDTVGVMQGSGRPFGDIRLARMACERLAELRGGHELRDLAVLLAHLKRPAEAYDLLVNRYFKTPAYSELKALASLAAGGAGAGGASLSAEVSLGIDFRLAAAEAAALDALRERLERDVAEASLKLTEEQ